MSLSAGSFSVDAETGEHSGSGAAYDILDAWWTARGSQYDGQSVATIVAVKEGIGDLAQSIAAGLIAHITANAEVTVTISTSTGALQQVDAADTDPPSAERMLPGTIA